MAGIYLFLLWEGDGYASCSLLENQSSSPVRAHLCESSLPHLTGSSLSPSNPESPLSHPPCIFPVCKKARYSSTPYPAHHGISTHPTALSHPSPLIRRPFRRNCSIFARNCGKRKHRTQLNVQDERIYRSKEKLAAVCNFFFASVSISCRFS